uniref:GDNF domain-containing protein n=1 Tax=Haemonchus contortus TaxID=6289 RepID=A0A7I4YCK4_HAECO
MIRGPLTPPVYDDDDEENNEHFEKDILVIANNFPASLNFFCNPRNELMRDRLCYGQLDQYALACADDTPPLQLVPFCLAFKRHCHLVNYPADDWCVREFDRYDEYCTRAKKSKCKSCTHDLSCYCEPYQCTWQRYGYETAIWCQRYELYCNEKERRNKADELVSLMDGAVRVHNRCMHLFNLPKVICDPFRRQFDYNRCMKFLFDCELISEWDDDEESGKDTSKEKGETASSEGSTKVLTPTPDDQKLAAKIAEEEKALEQLLKEKEKEDKEKQNRKPEEAMAGGNISAISSTTLATTTLAATNGSKALMNPIKNPFSAIRLVSRKRSR